MAAPEKLRVLDLFSGIGGFSLGLERTGGFETVAFCEIEDFPRRVLAKHWPNVPCYRDVRELTGEHVGPVDVITGGFPCQDISPAGKKAGLGGERSGLWREIARLIGELRPAFAIMENSAALLDRGMGDVLGDLASLGYDAEWHCIPASALGATHIRDRVWIVAYANEGGRGTPWPGQVETAPAARLITSRELNAARSRAPEWPDRSVIPGIADGISDVVDRGAALGNAVVPQIPELIGNAILAALNAPRSHQHPTCQHTNPSPIPRRKNSATSHLKGLPNEQLAVRRGDFSRLRFGDVRAGDRRVVPRRVGDVP
ncbi:MAG TPA: DNA (cytosine-5-)-methyltransferase [Croceibacterium sp.]|nr:DNA (cytosine-5-)-methyltransferase [Croceibacterium sp.]